MAANERSLQQQYVDLLEVFGRRIAVVQKQLRGMISVDETTDDHFVVAVDPLKPVVIQALSNRGVGKKRTLGVNLAFTQHLAAVHDGVVVEKSCIYLTYWRRKINAPAQKPAVWLDKWRFEFDTGPEEDQNRGDTIHPIYHAQLCEDGVGTNSKSTGNVHLSTPRVPIAPMNLHSVLEMLLADHHPRIFEDKLWLPEWRKVTRNMPVLGPATCAHQGTAHPGSHGSRCWYQLNPGLPNLG